jgi:hypothetical protein
MGRKSWKHERSSRRDLPALKGRISAMRGKNNNENDIEAIREGIAK